MSPPRSNTPHTSSNSSKASRGDQTTRALQSSFHNGDPQYTPPSPLTGLSSGQSSVLSSPTESHSEQSIPDEPYLPKATANKRDKLVGEAERILSKVIRDPELHERAVLRATGGKEAANGLAVADPNAV